MSAALLKLPVIEGVIRRRLLINFRADPEVVRQILPSGMSSKLHCGHSVVGICLIRLEKVRPKGMPTLISLSSENAAHRIAVEWNEDGQVREGVFIPRRDTDSGINALAGGRLFPGEHHHSRFDVVDTGESVSLKMLAADLTEIAVEARKASVLPPSSLFASLDEASQFFQGGCVGYSVTSDEGRFEGVELCVSGWNVAPLAVTKVESSYFGDKGRFPEGSIEFDHGLIMRDIPHEWHSAPEFLAGQAQ